MPRRPADTKLPLLLDTHVFLWWRADDARLSATARACLAVAPRVVVSAATAWEIAIKTQLGKLEIPGSVEDGVRDSGFEALPISFRHAALAGSLPALHRDPFDRMLVAQAIAEGLVLVSADAAIEPYDVDVLWAG